MQVAFVLENRSRKYSGPKWTNGLLVHLSTARTGFSTKLPRKEKGFRLVPQKITPHSLLRNRHPAFFVDLRRWRPYSNHISPNAPPQR